MVSVGPTTMGSVGGPTVLSGGTEAKRAMLALTPLLRTATTILRAALLRFATTKAWTMAVRPLGQV